MAHNTVFAPTRAIVSHMGPWRPRGKAVERAVQKGDSDLTRTRVLCVFSQAFNYTRGKCTLCTRDFFPYKRRRIKAKVGRRSKHMPADPVRGANSNSDAEKNEDAKATRAESLVAIAVSFFSVIQRRLQALLVRFR